MKSLNHASKQADHFDLLDLIKAVAAILIVFHHYQQVFDIRFDGINFFEGTIQFSRLVELFFLISGFVMWHSDRMRSPETLRQFGKSLRNKLLRIYPMAILACTAMILIANLYFGFFHSWARDSWAGCRDWKTIICSYLLVFRGWPFLSRLGINNPAWYLCILIICYLLFYVFSLLGRRLKVKRYILIIGLLIILDGLFWFDRLPSFVFGDALRGYRTFFLGVLLAELLSVLPKKLTFFASTGMIGGFVMILLIAPELFFAKQKLLLVALLFCPVIGLATVFSDVRCNIFRFLGKVSFSVYLWHLPIMSLLTLIERLAGIEVERSYLTMVATALLIELLAILIHLFVEKPIDRLIKKLTKKETVKI